MNFKYHLKNALSCKRRYTFAKNAFYVSLPNYFDFCMVSFEVV